MNKYLIKIAENKKDPGEKTRSRLAAASLGFGGAALGSQIAAAPMGIGFMVNQHKDTGVGYADVRSYTKAKNLRHVLQSENDHNVNQFMPGFKTKGGSKTSISPIASFSNPDAGMHEMGHAHSFNKARKRKLLGPKFGTYAASAKLGIGPLGMIAGAAAGSSKNEKVSKAAPYIMGAVAAPTLIEEAKATISPYRHLRKTRGSGVANKFLKKLAPAYGTYVAGAAGSIGAAMLARKLSKDSRKPKDVK